MSTASIDTHSKNIGLPPGSYRLPALAQVSARCLNCGRRHDGPLINDRGSIRRPMCDI